MGRTVFGLGAVLAGAALLFGAGAAPASADPGNGNANAAGQANGSAGGKAEGGAGPRSEVPGANGTVKVHEWPDHKNASDNANDPKVCAFELHGNSFDAGQTGRWWIQAHPWGNGDASMAANGWTGTYTANAGGDWTVGPLNASRSVTSGHFKLFVELQHRAGNSGNTVTTYKHKVFKIECAAAPQPQQGGEQEENGGQTVAGEEQGPSGHTQLVVVSSRTLETNVTLRIQGEEIFLPAGTQIVTTNLGTTAVLPTGENIRLGVVLGRETIAPTAPTAEVGRSVAGRPSAGGAVLGIAALPATSSAPANAPIGALGTAAIALGAYLLRHRRR